MRLPVLCLLRLLGIRTAKTVIFWTNFLRDYLAVIAPTELNKSSVVPRGKEEGEKEREGRGTKGEEKKNRRVSERMGGERGKAGRWKKCGRSGRESEGRDGMKEGMLQGGLKCMSEKR